MPRQPLGVEEDELAAAVWTRVLLAPLLQLVLSGVTLQVLLRLEAVGTGWCHTSARAEVHRCQYDEVHRRQLRYVVASLRYIDRITLCSDPKLH